MRRNILIKRRKFIFVMSLGMRNGYGFVESVCKINHKVNYNDYNLSNKFIIL